MALFINGFTAGDHAAKAVAAARRILREVELPVGTGVHTGNARVGFVGGGEDVLDFTALGDAVNTASRLGSDAETGELLLSDATVQGRRDRDRGVDPEARRASRANRAARHLERARAGGGALIGG